MVQLVTLFTINFLYLDIWLWWYIFLTLLGQHSIAFYPFWKAQLHISAPCWVHSQSIGFFIRASSNSFPKNPTVRAYLLLLNVCENVCVAHAGMWFLNLSCAVGRVRVSVQQCACVSFSPWPVASGLFHSLPCHNKHSVVVFHHTCTHSQHTHLHTKLQLTHSDIYSPH